MKKRETIRWVTKITMMLACVGVILLFDNSAVMKSHAYTQTTGKVLSSNVKVRAEANTTSEAVAGATSGSSVTITDEVTAADGKVWYQVSVDGKTGYVRSDLLEKAGTTAESKASAVKTEVTASDKKSGNVLKDSVRVRKEATTDADVVATVGRGVALTIEGEAKGADGKTWYSVSFSYNSKTVTGFIRSDFITFEALPEEEPEVTEINGTMGEGEEATAGTEVATEPTTQEVETPETQQQPETTQQQGQYQLLNVEEVPKVPSGYTEIQLKWNEEDIKAWKNGDFYIFYARADDGTEGWYRFDSVGGTYQRYDAELEAGKGGSGSTVQMIIIIVLAVVVVALIIVVTLLLMKLNDYKISEQWDDDEDDEDEEEDESVRKERAKKTWRALNFLSAGDEDDEEDEDDDEFDEIDYDDEDEDDDEEELPIRTRRRPQSPQRPAASRPVASRPTGTPAGQGQAPVRRPAQQPVARPTGAPVGQGQGQAPVRRPAPQPVTRPTGAPVGQGQAPVRRPAPQPGTRPTGAPVGQGQAPVRRPAPQPGTRPQGAPVGQGQAPVRRPAPQPGTRPAGAQGQGQAPVRRPAPQPGTRPTRQPIRPEKMDD